MGDRWNHPGHAEWHGPPPARFVRRRLFLAVGGLFLFATIIGSIAGLVLAAMSRPGPWIWLVLLPIILLMLGGGRGMRRTFRPVGDLIDATARLGDGEPGVRIEATAPGPFRPVIHSFNRMAARLDEEDERRRRFLADLGHELKTPLAVLRGEIEALIDGVRPADEHHLTSLLDDVGTAERLVEDLRTLTLTEAGRLELHTEELDLGSLALESLESAETLMHDHDVTLDWATSGDVVIMVDPMRVRQVIWNLVTNALRAMPTGGILGVGVTGEPDAVRIAVTDTGRGIDGARLETIFDRFEKSADSSGSGLGLTIVRDLVEAHGGTITAQNVGGSGARFEILLPR